MVELRARKPSATKATTTTKAPSKRKAAPSDDVSASAPKKVKEDVQPKKAKRSDSITKNKGKKEKPVPVEDANEESENDEEQNAEGDNEAQALAKIVDSDAEEEEDDVSANGEAKDLELPEVPEKAAKSSEADESEPGVVYIGRIPRGFYEHQMREYFSQFGQVNKIRMSRNKATGRSKHFAFIEFAERGVAEIVAKTMDNYLLAGHILKVKMVPKSQIHEKLWVGANKRFKQVPWNKIAGNRLKKPLTESAWTARISKEEQKRNERAKKLSELGYEFELPKLKTIEALKETPAAIESVDEEAQETLEAAPVAEKTPNEEPKTTKKAAKSDKKAPAKAAKKGKKGKKTVS